jgi:anti-anti-sigma regulatory factor
MITIDITSILSAELKSRNRVSDLLLYIENTQEKEITIDFSKVEFATRSFIDEFYNTFLKDPRKNDFALSLTNIPEDINTMIESVSHTQTKAKTVPPSSVVKSFDSVNDLISYMSTVAF